MAILNQPGPKTFIDLSGSQGNAFYLINQAKLFAKQLGKDHNKIAAEMMAGNYEELLLVFDRVFGEYCDLVRWDDAEEEDDAEDDEDGDFGDSDVDDEESNADSEDYDDPQSEEDSKWLD